MHNEQVWEAWWRGESKDRLTRGEGAFKGSSLYMASERRQTCSWSFLTRVSRLSNFLSIRTELELIWALCQLGDRFRPFRLLRLLFSLNMYERYELLEVLVLKDDVARSAGVHVSKLQEAGGAIVS